MVGIKDFGMPSCCNNCEMSSCKGWENFYCDITLEEVDMDSDKRDKNCPLVEAIPKDQYEARLKADLEAVLEDLDLRLEEMENPYSTRVSGCSKDGWEHGVKNSRFLIQQKINSLKEKDNGNK